MHLDMKSDPNIGRIAFRVLVLNLFLSFVGEKIGLVATVRHTFPKYTHLSAKVLPFTPGLLVRKTDFLQFKSVHVCI